MLSLWAISDYQQKHWKPWQLEQGHVADRRKDGYKILKRTYRKEEVTFVRPWNVLKDRKQWKTFIRAAPSSVTYGWWRTGQKKKQRHKPVNFVVGSPAAFAIVSAQAVLARDFAPVPNFQRRLLLSQNRWRTEHSYIRALNSQDKYATNFLLTLSRHTIPDIGYIIKTSTRLFESLITVRYRPRGCGAEVNP